MNEWRDDTKRLDENDFVGVSEDDGSLILVTMLMLL